MTGKLIIRDLMPTNIIYDMLSFPVVRVILASYLGLLKGSVIAPRRIYTKSLRIILVVGTSPRTLTL